MDIISRVFATIKKYDMIGRGQSVLIGLSGGPDSVCLTLILKELSAARGMGLTLSAIYIDHGLRPDETPSEAVFCEALCKRLGVNFVSAHIDVPRLAEKMRMNRQEAARELRYLELEGRATAMKADCIALAHNLNDQVETFFMRILRGTGPRGLAGIPPVRGRIVRPLIETERGEIEEFLTARGEDFVVDSSNLKDDYLRNRVRGTLIPVVLQMNPAALKTIGNAADIFREEERYFDVTVTKAMMKLITRKGDGSIELFLSPLAGMDKVILRRLIRRALQETRDLRGIGAVHVEDIITLIKGGRPGGRVTLPKGIRAVLKYSTLLITTREALKFDACALKGEGRVEITETGDALEAALVEAGQGAPPAHSADAAVLDADKAMFPLCIRPRREGDRFHPAGMEGSKKLQDFFVDAKVPREDRGSVPIVTSGEDIVWVAGYRADERFRAGPGTSRFLVLRLIRHGDN